MDTRIADRPAFRLVGHSARVPLIHEGANPHIQAHIASLAEAEHLRLKALSDTVPAGLLQVSADVDPDYTEGSELTYLHGVAVSEGTPVPEDLDGIEVPAGTWAVFRTAGPYPAPLQSTWQRPPPTGSPPTPAGFGTARPSSPFSTAQPTSAPRPLNCGFPWNGPNDES